MHGFGTYRAADYDELIDHPVEMGELHARHLHGRAASRTMSPSPARHNADLERLCRDLKTLCESQIRLFGEPAPMDRYVFLVTALGEGYGGLEHRASTALLCSRDDLPQPGVEEVTESYRTFLGLCSHEYFHTWNVKRIKPAAFVPYDLERENYTTLLWAFEGITSYYDDLAAGALRPDLRSATTWRSLGRSITNLLRSPGRMKQTVAEASCDAWIKYYRQDENSPNALVSYYLKGSLIALCLDLLIRSRTRGRKSLDDLMRALWQRYGQTGVGVPEDGIEKLAEEIAGARLRDFLRQSAALHRRAAAEAVACDGRPATCSCVRPKSPGDKGGKPPSKQPLRALAARVALGARTAEDTAGVQPDSCAGRRRRPGRRPLRRRRAGRDRTVYAPAPAIWTSALPSTGPARVPRYTDSAATSCSSARSCCKAAPIDTCSLAVDRDGRRRPRRRRESWLCREQSDHDSQTTPLLVSYDRRGGGGAASGRSRPPYPGHDLTAGGRAHRLPRVLQVRELPARRRIQVPRRLQRHLAAQPEQRRRGVLAYSSGNHAQAVALAAELLGTTAVIVMPQDAPQVKLEATRGYGGEIVTYDKHTTVREELAARIARERGLDAHPALRPSARRRRARAPPPRS